MIRLIACDLDGTLLDGARRLPARLPALLDELDRRGIYFCAASGRQYENVYKTFGSLAERISYIAENGAVLCRGRERLRSAELPGGYFARPITIVRENGLSCAMSCWDTAYFEGTPDPVFDENAQIYYTERRFCDDLIEVAKTERPYKLAVFCKDRAEEVALPLMLPCADKFSVMLAGADWVDLMGPTIDKGVGLSDLCALLGVDTADSMAFGDYLNDLALIETAGHSYCMENGHPDLKKAARFIAPPNTEDGVVRAICAAVGIGYDTL